LRLRPAVRYVYLEIDLLWAAVVATCLVAALALYSVRTSRRPPAPAAVVAETRASSPESTLPPPSPAPEPKSRRMPGGRPATGPPAPRPEFAPEPARPTADVVTSTEPTAPENAVPPQEAKTKDSVRRDAAIEAEESAASPPVLLRRVEPVVPDVIRRGLGRGSSCTVQAVIDDRGEVTSVRILPPAPAGLERPIQEALRQWRYRPALRGGQPVPAYLTVVIYF
jgi:hypothetical protein